MAQQFRTVKSESLEGGGNSCNETSVPAGSGQKGKEGDFRGRGCGADLGQRGRRGTAARGL